jgi:hypothetical protein
MVHPLDVFDLVEREIERRQLCKGFKAPDVSDSVVIEIDLL